MSEVRLADKIRDFVNQRYFKPAREAGRSEVEVRSGDVQAEMNPSQRLPAVCAALGSDKIENDYRVRRIGIRGLLNGANAYFVFQV